MSDDSDALAHGLSVGVERQVVSVPPIGNPPIIEEVLDQVVSVGEVVDLLVNEIGGDGADQWTVGPLPRDLTWEVVDSDTIRIFGTVTEGIPLLEEVQDQVVNVGQVVNLFVNEIGGAGVDDWTVGNLPRGLTWEIVDRDTIRIFGTVAEGIEPVLEPVEDQIVKVGDVVELFVNETGGAGVDDWTVGGLPNGLSWEVVDINTIRIFGTVSA